jgi:hypothetical protein
MIDYQWLYELRFLDRFERNIAKIAYWESRYGHLLDWNKDEDSLEEMASHCNIAICNFCGKMQFNCSVTDWPPNENFEACSDDCPAFHGNIRYIEFLDQIEFCEEP